MIFQREIQLETTGLRHMHDLTDEVAQVVSASRIRSGVANIFNVGRWNAPLPNARLSALSQSRHPWRNSHRLGTVLEDTVKQLI
jgi:hypothetical protein